MIHFYVIDTETNGLNVKMHEICQISVIRCSDRMQLTRNIRVNNPENSSYDALKIIGKSMNDLRSGSEKRDVINEVEHFLSEDKQRSTHRCMIAHNASFDRKFLCELWGRFYKKFPFDLYLDTIHMFKDYGKKQGYIRPKANLTSACETMGIKKMGNAHDAVIDTRHTYLLWDKLSKTIDFMDHIKNIPHNI